MTTRHGVKSHPEVDVEKAESTEVKAEEKAEVPIEATELKVKKAAIEVVEKLEPKVKKVHTEAEVATEVKVENPENLEHPEYPE